MPLRPDDFRLRPHEIHVWHSSLAGAEGAPAELALLEPYRKDLPAELFSGLKRQGLAAFGVIRPDIHIHKGP